MFKSVSAFYSRFILSFLNDKLTYLKAANGSDTKKYTGRPMVMCRPIRVTGDEEGTVEDR